MTPDGRYFVVRGRLWRMANPQLDEAERARAARYQKVSRTDKLLLGIRT